ncbi:MAG: secretion system protein [Peptococcaceae bacterium BICA1-7]|nr:MAG: secretion system protein [Peptococcaceae bacterium BICA1-7]HBV98140.1 secretion system protein [Desulfotomaculum sp.]
MALIFGSCCLFIIGLHHALTGYHSYDFKKRLNDLSKEKDHPKVPEEKTLTPSQRLLSNVSRSAIKIRLFNRLARMVDKNLAGADIPLKSEEYIVLAAGLSVLAGLVTSLLLLNPVHGVLAGLTVIILSILWLRMAKARRLGRFNSQIGDALVIMSNALRSGFSFLQAMDMVRKELPNPLSKEFGRTFQEMSLGTPTEEALDNLNARVGSEDLDLVITAVLIQRQVGGNLAEILDNIASTIRERIRIKGEIKTLTAQGKMSGFIIGLLPVVLAGVMSLISPDYLGVLFTSPLGLAMLIGAVILELIGILLIRKIIDIKI